MWSDNVNGNAFHARQPDVRYARITFPSHNARLAISMTATPRPVNVGSILTYRVTVTNTGGQSAEDNYVVLPLSPKLTFTSATPPAFGRCDRFGRFVACNILAVPAGGSKTTTIRARGHRDRIGHVDGPLHNLEY